MFKRLPVLILIITLFVPAALSALQDRPPVTLELTGVDPSQMPEVIVTANVYDALGQPVPGLTAENFTLTGELADRAQIVSVQNISDDNLPFATVLLIDISTSMNGTPIQRAREAARAYVEGVRDNDPIAIMTFGTSVNLVQDYTTDKQALYNAIDSLVDGGQTALYQGTYDAVELGANSPVPRRAVILLSDGAEYGGVSQVAREAALQEAIARGVPVYTIGLGFGFDRTYLQQLARGTNTRFYDQPSPDELTLIYGELAALLRSQYVITLNADLPLDGTEYDLGLQVNVGEATASQTTTLRSPVPVPIVRVPQSPSEPIAEPTTFEVEVAADDPLEAVVFELDGVELLRSAEPPFAVEIDPVDYQPGDYELVINAADDDGDSSSAVLPFSVAALPSEVSFQPDLASLGAIAEPTEVALLVTGQTAPTEIAYSVGGGVVQPLEAPYTFTIDPMALNPGPNELTVEVTNAGGASTIISAPFEVAPLPPQVTIGDLQDGQTVDAPLSVGVNVIGQTPVTRADAVVGDTVLPRAADGLMFQLDPMQLTPGASTLDVIVETDNGQSTTESLNFIVAALPPEISISGLTPGETLYANRRIDLEFSSQTPVSRVTSLVDGEQLDRQTSAPFGVDLDVLAIGPGEHTLSITADNQGGQSSSVEIPFVISETPSLTATASVPTSTPEPSNTPEPSVTPIPPTVDVGATRTADFNIAQVATADAQATADASQQAEAGTAVAAESTASAAESTQAAEGTLVAQAALDAQGTQAAQPTMDARSTLVAGVNATRTTVAQGIAVTSTAFAAGTQTAVAAETALAGTSEAQATANALATQAAEETSVAQATANALATQAAEETSVAQATANAATQAAEAAERAAAAQLMAATSQAMATERAQARIDAQATRSAQAAAELAATQTAEASSRIEAAQLMAATSQVMATERAQDRIDAQATRSAQAETTLAAATANAQATLDAQDALNAMATLDAEATISAMSTIDAQAAVDAQSTLDAEATVSAQATLDAEATAEADAQATSDAQATLDADATAVAQTAEETPEAQAEASATFTPRPSLTPIGTLTPIVAEEPPVSSDLVPILVVIAIVLIIVIFFYIILRGGRRRSY